MPDPQFGGTNGVDELDIGQVGSTRRGADEARWTGRVLEGPDQAGSVITNLPGQNIAFRNALGFTGKTVTWEGTLKTSDDAMMRAIAADLNKYLHGGVTAPDPDQLKATRLTDSAGAVLCQRAVMRDWEFTTNVMNTPTDATLTRLVKLRIVFDCLEPAPAAE